MDAWSGLGERPLSAKSQGSFLCVMTVLDMIWLMVRASWWCWCSLIVPLALAARCILTLMMFAPMGEGEQNVASVRVRVCVPGLSSCRRAVPLSGMAMSSLTGGSGRVCALPATRTCCEKVSGCGRISRASHRLGGARVTGSLFCGLVAEPFLRSACCAAPHGGRFVRQYLLGGCHGGPRPG